MGRDVVPEKRAFEWDGGAFLHDVYRYRCLYRYSWE